MRAENLPQPGAPLPHYVNAEPFDPNRIEVLSPAQERVFLASQWRLMWWKFKRHKLAVISLSFLGFVYFCVVFAEMLTPYNPDTRHLDQIYAPPQAVRLFHDGRFIGPHVLGFDHHRNMEMLKHDYTVNPKKVMPLSFFCKGEPYEFWGLIELRGRLMCADEKGYAFLLGTDWLGRDMLSRIVHGARVSMTIGLIGVAVSIVLGLFFGGIAGYFGGGVDLVVQRIIEVLQSLPSIPLWLAIAAIVPVQWSPIAVYFFITAILGLIEWTGLARAVRSKLLSLREEDYVLAAQLMGAKSSRVLTRHLLPGVTSHLIAAASLSIPSMILGETALSFLGLGLRAPITSWGVLLNDAQNISVVALYPWLILPVVPVIFVVLAFNFLGDGLRDAADPYK